MFKVHSITLKNFLSIGNQTQAVDFSGEALTLIIGENLDLGGDDAGSRNGVGKTALVNALSYALYGQALNDIRKENLINKTNGKNMLVTVKFEKDGINYRVERGRKPNILKLFIDDEERADSTEEDDSQGDSRETQKFINQILDMSHSMFRHLVALNTYTIPFLSMKAADQREVIEQLLGITLLSEKAETLKLASKASKDTIQIEQLRIESIKTANENVQKSIDTIVLRSRAWEAKKDQDLENLAKSIMKLEHIDIEAELLNHTNFKIWQDRNDKLNDLKSRLATETIALTSADKMVSRYTKEIETLADKKCPQCEQDLHDHKHNTLLEQSNSALEDSVIYQDAVVENIELLNITISEINVGVRPLLVYTTESEALGHKNNLTNLENALSSKAEEMNPYDEQIDELKKSAIQSISWDEVNRVIKLRDHQEFLLKLLTNKDSFIRKKIIDQNLNYLNKRLSYYIEKLGLPHLVVFQNDLTVEITHYGQDLDFDNLSRGERNRLILSLSFAFRDVWENLYQSINLLFVDELMDAGMDAAGVESGLAVLKKMARERHKNIYLISHKEELMGRVNNVLRVIKEGGFTTYAESTDYIES